MIVNARAFFILSFALPLISCAPAPEQHLEIVQAEERTVTATGYGEVNVVPDYAVWVVGIESYDRDVVVATDENEAIASDMLNVLRHYNITDENIHVEFIDTTPDVNYDAELVTRFIVSRVMRITIHDLSILADLKANVMITGVNRDYDVYFQVEDWQAYKDQARELAIQDALRKAQMLAAELGQEVEGPRSITELRDFPPPEIGYRASPVTREYYGNVPSSDYMSFGQIVLGSEVTVEFLLK